MNKPPKCTLCARHNNSYTEVEAEVRCVDCTVDHYLTFHPYDFDRYIRECMVNAREWDDLELERMYREEAT